MENNLINELTFRTYEKKDYPALKKVMQLAFADMGSPYVLEQEMNMLSDLYPNGQIVAVSGDEIVGAVISRITDYNVFKQPHTVDYCSDTAVFIPEAKVGDAIYGMDVFVNPNTKHSRIGKKLVNELLQRVFEDNFRVFVGTSRVIGYHKYADQMDCQTYVENVKNRTLFDPVLCFHLSYGMQTAHITPYFADDDVLSVGHGVHIEMYNPQYNAQLPVFPERVFGLAKYDAPLSRLSASA
jgi:ribosomal protein S18 acetylase RimI-like enzyme